MYCLFLLRFILLIDETVSIKPLQLKIIKTQLFSKPALYIFLFQKLLMFINAPPSQDLKRNIIKLYHSY